MPQIPVRRVALLVLASIVGASALGAQAARPGAGVAAAGVRGGPPDAGAHVAAMRRLAYMVGDWRGAGWIERGTQRAAFRGGERVQWKVGETALLVEGSFVGRVPGAAEEVPVHVTLGVIHFDPRTQAYRFASWLASGSHGERPLALLDDGWQWEMQPPGAVIRYRMRLTPGGEWLETGEMSTDGRRSWRQFFEMRLAKAP